MGDSTSPLANADARELLMRAVESERGIRVTLPTAAAAHSIRRRMNTVRASDRKLATQRHAPDHPMYGVSDFDVLELAIEGCVLTVRKTSNISGLVVEDL